MALILGIKYLILRFGLWGEVRGIREGGKAFIFTWRVNRHKARLTFSKFLGITMEGLIEVGAIIFTLQNCLVKGVGLVGYGRSMLRDKGNNKFQSELGGVFALGHQHRFSNISMNPDSTIRGRTLQTKGSINHL